MVGINWGYSRGITLRYLECVADVQVRMAQDLRLLLFSLFS